jgi:transcriptional regulator with XRE-family HTH domain/tetratricopeptide (TPR) repeat protein
VVGVEPVDPRWFERADLRAALAGHDIGVVYRALQELGVSQRRIAELTGQSQSEVSEIVHGRTVNNYGVLVRIAEGLGVPREQMGLSFGAYAGEAVARGLAREVLEEMRRRVLLASAGITLVGKPVPGVGELRPLPAPSPVPLPDRVGGLHVVKVRNLTQWLDETSCAYGSDPQVSSATATWASGLLEVPGAESVQQALLIAVAELHLQAGLDAFDAGLYERAMYHYQQGLELAIQAGDAYCQVLALNYAGLAHVEHGHPHDGLKMFQASQVKTQDITPDDERGFGEGSRAALEACSLADSATALAQLGVPDAAEAALAQSRQRWQPTSATSAGDLDKVAALLALERGRLDAAHAFATASARLWEDRGRRRGHTAANIVLATIHVRAGEPDGLKLAHEAISGATKLSSTRIRRLLEPLATALKARPGGDYRDLARKAHHIATTRV